MLQIKIHATGSSGNAYTIQDGPQKILIDPGIRFRALQKATGFTLSQYDFVLLSHEHKDHSKSIPALLKHGLACAMSAGTCEAMGLAHPNILTLRSKAEFEHLSWRVLPFATVHDAAEPLGFLILSPSGKKILFATDTARIGYKSYSPTGYEWISHKFNGVTHWMVEANYQEDLLAGNEKLPNETKERIRQSHMPIDRLVEFFGKQDLSKTEEIHLIHLSKNNSNSEDFISSVKKTTAKNVYAIR